MLPTLKVIKNKEEKGFDCPHGTSNLSLLSREITPSCLKTLYQIFTKVTMLYVSKTERTNNAYGL